LFYETKGWVLRLALVSHPGMATVGFPDIGLPDFLTANHREIREQNKNFFSSVRIFGVFRG